MRREVLRAFPILALPILSLAASGCASEGAADPSPFTLRFAAVADDAELTCTSTVGGLGAEGGATIGLGDLRFYVSNLRFADADGQPVALTLDANEYQLQDPAGSVALIDLTGNQEGSCASNAGASEGTARTNAVITGTTLVEDVVSVSFDVGVPQALMKKIVASHTAEGAPSPLNEMYWTWASGYRHFVFDFTIEDAAGASGVGHVHLGSLACGPADGLALEDRDTCGFVNTPAVSLEAFDLAGDTVTIDVRAILADLDLVAPIVDMATHEVLGSGPGAACHSMPMQEDCATLFPNFGLDLATGAADPGGNGVFGVK